MKADFVSLQIATAYPMDKPADGAAFLRRLAQYPKLVPEKIGDTEPLRKLFEIAKIDELTDTIWNSFMTMWTRRGPRAGGNLSPGRPHRHGRLSYLIYDVKFADMLTGYLRKEAVALRADIGCVETGWPNQKGRTGTFVQTYPPSTLPEEFDLLGGGWLYTVEIKDHLAQLSWATVFGPPYVRMFGRERLLSAPAAIVEEIAPEMVYIQLTPEVCDVTKDLKAYFAVRRRVKEHIGPDAFFDPAKGNGPYRVPKFDLEPWPQPRPLGSIGGAPIVGLIAGHPIIEQDGKKEILEEMDFGAEAFGPLGIRPKGTKPQFGKIGGREIVAVQSGHPVVEADGGTEIRTDIVLGWHVETKEAADGV